MIVLFGIEVSILFVGAIIVVGVGVLLFLLFGKSKDRPAGDSTKTLPISSQDLIHEINELEQKMANVTGGTAGMEKLLDMIQNSSESNTDLYREQYRDLQEQLRIYMQKYNTSLEQAKTLPKDERARFVRSEKIKKYQKFLDENV